MNALIVVELLIIPLSTLSWSAQPGIRLCGIAIAGCATELNGSRMVSCFTKVRMKADGRKSVGVKIERMAQVQVV